jgi:hypothetical protein
VATISLSARPPTDLDGLDTLIDRADGVPWELLDPRP